MKIVDEASTPEQYIGEPVEAQFDSPPILEKKPGCPNGFIWRGRLFRVLDTLNEWHDYGLRGKSEAFYVKEQGSFRAKAAKRTGTWGVGRDFFRVRVDGGRIFDLYYDRAPKGSKQRKGMWFLFQELSR